MCTVCGCGGDNKPKVSPNTHGGLHFGQGAARAHVPGLSQGRIIEIERNILSENDNFAQRNRDILLRRKILALNLVSSPGAGKTTLLVRSIEDLKAEHNIGVIEGDQETTFDADRIRATGVRALQVNTGKGCHLDAHMVGQALEQLNPEPGSLLFIENVGNLVCPAAFDLGEKAKVVILSVTEGEDKPLKYPDMFHAASLMILNKIDLLPYVQFNVEKCKEMARRVNPALPIIELSATTGKGLDSWYNWIKSARN